MVIGVRETKMRPQPADYKNQALIFHAWGAFMAIAWKAFQEKRAVSLALLRSDGRCKRLTERMKYEGEHFEV